MNEKLPLEVIIAKNLVYYRKESGLTQLQIAEKLNYSDKSISKWERAESLPDIKTLKALADFYEITINDLLSDKKRVPKLEYKKRHLIITLMSVGLAFLLATTVYFITSLIFTYALTWLIYIYILPVASIILVVFSSLWAKRLWVTLSVSLLEWTSALSIFISLIMFVANLMEYAWLIFLVAFVLQLITILWHFYGIKISITKNATPSFKKKKN
jgi:transcriptional regulator with XRE-family HTH domain